MRLGACQGATRVAAPVATTSPRATAAPSYPHRRGRDPARASRPNRRAATCRRVGVSSPANNRRIVDFPTPFGPTSATRSPLATRNDTSSNRRSPPGYANPTLCNWMAMCRVISAWWRHGDFRNTTNASWPASVVRAAHPRHRERAPTLARELGRSRLSRRRREPPGCARRSRCRMERNKHRRSGSTLSLVLAEGDHTNERHRARRHAAGHGAS